MPVVVLLLFTLFSLAIAVPAAGAGDFEGKSCEDHDPCTTDDRFVAGMCRGTPRVCDDGLACTEDFCDRATGRCGAGLRIDYCLIDGACYRDGESSPGNPCMVCRPVRSTTRWTETAVCDDGDPCTLDDRCIEGRCEGTRYSCGVAAGCMASRCDGLGGCVVELMAGHCRIAGYCARDRDLHPVDPCLQCDPSVSIGEWTPATGTTCPGGTCSDGVCLATIVIEVEGSGAGRVLGPGFSCTAACIRQLVPERPIDLTVVPENGSVFSGWRGACLGLAPCKLSPYGQASVSARFERDVLPAP
jgi:hypothetical protein